MITPHPEGRFITLAESRQKRAPRPPMTREHLLELWNHLARMQAINRIDVAMMKKGVTPETWAKIACAAESIAARQANQPVEPYRPAA